MTGSKKRKFARGFTLIEMLVAMSIFVTVAMAATDLFIAASRSSKSVRTRERLQNEARFALDAITREIRSGTIDYAAYGGSVPFKGSELKLRDSNNNIEIFRMSAASSECLAAAAHPCLLICNASSCSPLTSQNVRWDGITFYITPQSDPFLFDPVSGTYASSEQPHISVVARLHTESNLPEERAQVTIQALMSSRVYKR